MRYPNCKCYQGSTRLSLYAVICKTKYKAFLFSKTFLVGWAKFILILGSDISSARSQIWIGFGRLWWCLDFPTFHDETFCSVTSFPLKHNNIPQIMPIIVIWHTLLSFQTSGLSTPWKRRVGLRRSIDQFLLNQQQKQILKPMLAQLTCPRGFKAQLTRPNSFIETFTHSKEESFCFEHCLIQKLLL